MNCDKDETLTLNGNISKELSNQLNNQKNMGGQKTIDDSSSEDWERELVSSILNVLEPFQKQSFEYG